MENHELSEQMDEINRKVKKMEEESAEFYRQCGFSPEQVKGYISNPDNFSRPQWHALEKERKRLEAMLECKIDAVEVRPIAHPFPHPQIQGHWIFVR